MVNPYRLLFEPFRLGRFELPNRIMMAPMGSNLATVKGEVTEQLIDHYRARAQGGAGLIVIEGTSVHGSGRGYPRQLSAADDSFSQLSAASFICSFCSASSRSSYWSLSVGYSPEKTIGLATS